MNSAGEFLVVLFLILLNGVFSLAETALVSARRARLQQRAEAGDDQARAALALIHRPDRFLSTVQIGITLIGIVAGAFGGAGLAKELAAWLGKIGLPSGAAGSLAFFLVIAFLTYLSLVVGELTPKALALNNPENIAARIAGPMTALSRAASPLVWLLTLSTSGLLRVLGVRPSTEPPITADEVNILIEQGTKAGVFAEEEQAIVERVFRTAERRAATLMTPRREIVSLDTRDDWSVNREKIAASHHSLFPVTDGGMDQVLGVVAVRQIWEASQGGEPSDLRSLALRPPYLLGTTRVLQALDQMRNSRQHLALVVDEYGNVDGLLTLHDILEAMVGEVQASGEDPQDRDAVQRPDGSWLLDGMMPFDEVCHLLQIRALPENAGDFTTLGGFVMAHLSRIPAATDTVEWDAYRFEVVDMDGNRVDRILATQLPAAKPPPAA